MGKDTEDWVRDEESARRIRERTIRHSTEAKFGTSEPAMLLEYYEYNAHERLTCPNCFWSGQAGDATLDHHEELFDVTCPRCEKMLLVVGHPTVEQITEAAAAGNAEAIAELAEIEKARRREDSGSSLTAGGDRAGNLALAAINGIRGTLGLDVIAGLRFSPCDHSRFGCLDCALGNATGGSVREDPVRRRYVVDLGDTVLAARAATRLQLEHEHGSTAVPLPSALDSLVVADAFELTFRDRDGMLIGWVEPNDAEPRLWDLHLFPGRDYPPGHEPEQK